MMRLRGRPKSVRSSKKPAPSLAPPKFGLLCASEIWLVVCILLLWASSLLLVVARLLCGLRSTSTTPYLDTTHSRACGELDAHPNKRLGLQRKAHERPPRQRSLFCIGVCKPATSPTAPCLVAHALTTPPSSPPSPIHRHTCKPPCA